jgi:putative hemolysin
MGNFVIENRTYGSFVISVNPFESRKEAYSSSSGMRETLKHLEEGGCIGIFPAGEVSNKNNEYGEVLDKQWEKRR